MASLKKEAKKKEREEPLEVSQDRLKSSGGKTDGLIDLLGWLNNWLAGCLTVGIARWLASLKSDQQSD